MADVPPRDPDSALERRWQTVLEKLVANADRLAKRGSLVAGTSSSGRTVWTLRLLGMEGGRRVHKNIYIADDHMPEILRRTSAWLARCRARGARAVSAEVAHHARLGAAIGGIARRLHRKLAPARRRGPDAPSA